MSIKSELILNNIKLDLHLGCSEEERSKKQTVLVNIILKFDKAPKGCETDRLEDSDCYYTLIKNVLEKTVNRPFNLIEHVTMSLHHSVKKHLPHIPHIEITVRKNLVPLGLSGEAIFKYAG